MRNVAMLCALLMLTGCGKAARNGKNASHETTAVGTAPKTTGTGPVLSGDVVGAHHRPVQGAKVVARFHYGAGAAGLRGISTTTDAAGHFVLDVVRRLNVSGVVPVWIAVSATGFVPREWELPSYDPRLGQHMEITLSPAAILTGHVVGADGQPISGAVVYVIRRQCPGVEKLGDVTHVTSGADGSYRIETVPKGTFDVGAKADGRIPNLVQNVKAVPKEARKVPDIVLSPGLHISGKVTSTGGTPVEGAEVRVWRLESAAGFILFGRSTIAKAGGIVETGRDGTFDVGGLAPGSYTVEVEAAGYKTVDAERRGVQPPAKGVDLELAKDAQVMLTIRDGKTQKPIEKFTLSLTLLTGPTDTERRAALQDLRHVKAPFGKYSFAARSKAIYGLEIAAPGYRIYRHELQPLKPGEVKKMRVWMVPR